MTSAKIVIVGGGIVGCSVAYHLGRMGISDVLLLERAKLSSGSTWHAAGLVGQLRTNANVTQLLGYSVALYDRLEAETFNVFDRRPSLGAIDWAKIAMGTAWWRA